MLYDQRTMAAQFTAVRECYAIGPDDRLVAAFAPFALYGPALGIPVAVPDCDITKPASLRAEALADACAAVEATIVFAAPAALDGVLASQETLTADGRRRSAALRLVLSAGAPVPQRTLEAFSRLAPAAELHTPYGMTEVLSVADIDLETLAAVGPGRGVCVGRPLAGVGLRIEPLAGGNGECGEIVVSAPWLSLGYDGLWATNDRARTVDAAVGGGNNMREPSLDTEAPGVVEVTDVTRPMPLDPGSHRPSGALVRRPEPIVSSDSHGALTTRSRRASPSPPESGSIRRPTPPSGSPNPHPWSMPTRASASRSMSATKSTSVMPRRPGARRPGRGG